MLEPLGELAVRMTKRTESYQATENRHIALQKAIKVVEERPIENAKESATAESSDEQDTDGYKLDDDAIFYEKYDKNGNVIIRVPQEKKPIDELV